MTCGPALKNFHPLPAVETPPACKLRSCCFSDQWLEKTSHFFLFYNGVPLHQTSAFSLTKTVTSKSFHSPCLTLHPLFFFRLHKYFCLSVLYNRLHFSFYFPENLNQYQMTPKDHKGWHWMKRRMDYVHTQIAVHFSEAHQWGLISALSFSAF